MGSVGGLYGRRPVRRKGCWSLILERTVRSQEVIVRPPTSQLLPHILEREEDFHVQTLISEAPIEAFDEAVLDRLTWPNKIQLHPMAIGPGIHDATGKFAAVVDGDRARGATLAHDRLQGLRDLLACERLIGQQAEAFTGVLVDDGQNPKPPTIRHAF